MARKEKVSDEQIAQALVASFGIQTQAVAWLQNNYGIHLNRSTLCRRISKSKKLQQSLQEGNDKMGDVAESRLYKLVSEGNLKAITFYLSNKCRDRGYGTKSYEISGANGEPIQTENTNKVEIYLPDNGR